MQLVVFLIRASQLSTFIKIINDHCCIFSIYISFFFSFKEMGYVAKDDLELRFLILLLHFSYSPPPFWEEGDRVSLVWLS